MNAHIQCGLSQAFHNKQNHSGSKSAFGSSFVPSQVSLADFVTHITGGKAWTQGYFKGRSRRKDAFISAQTLALDLDDHVSVEDALRQPLIAGHALLVHPSPSSQPDYPKTRVVFVLSAAITNVDEWEAMQRGLIAHFAHLKPDPACKDAARLFYGSDVGTPHVNLAARLDVATARGMVRHAPEDHTHDDERRAVPPLTAPPSQSAPPPAAHSHGELSPDLIRDVERALGLAGSTYNKEGFSTQAVACPVRHHEHDGHSPAAYWHHDKHFLHCFKCGADYTTHEVAEALGIRVGDYYAKRDGEGETVWDRVVKSVTGAEHDHNVHRVEEGMKNSPTNHDGLPHLTDPDITVNLRYISQIDKEIGKQMLTARGVLVKSPIGTGKTHLAGMMVRALDWLAKQDGRSLRVLALTHRQALAENLADRLSESGVAFECYKGFNAADLRRIPCLSICYDSLYKLAAVGEKLPRYDLIIIDEIEQFHQHLGGNTMRDGGPERAYGVLRQLVKETPRFLGMDAHLSDVSRDWLAGMVAHGTQSDTASGAPPCAPTQHNHQPCRDTACRVRDDNNQRVNTPSPPEGCRILTIQNVYRQERGNLMLHRYKDHAIHTAMQLALRDEGPVVIPTNSRGMAKKLGHLFAATFGDEKVLVIHGQNANDRAMQQLIRDINRRISQYRVVIYSPSLGTGVDITTPVRAVVGVFSHQPISPMDMHQMLGRCRNAQERHAWVEGRQGNLDTEWKAIYHRHERNALVTGFYCQFDADGILAVTDIQRSMLKLLSLLEAQRNRAMNDPLTAFVRLALDAGFVLTFNSTRDKETRAQVKAAGEAVKLAEKTAVLAADPVTHEEVEAHQVAGTLTPEIQAGYERYKIESCVGLTINSEIYDDLYTSQQREEVRRFADLDTDEAILQQSDRHDAAQNMLLSKRRHRAMRRRLLAEVIRALWGEGRDDTPISVLLQRGTDQAHALTEDEIAARLHPFLAARWHDLQTYLGWRHDQSHDPKAVLRWLLKQIGLHLRSKQTMVAGVRFRVYTIDPEQIDKIGGYARARLALLARLMEEKTGRPPSAHYSKRVYNTSQGGSE